MILRRIDLLPIGITARALIMERGAREREKRGTMHRRTQQQYKTMADEDPTADVLFPLCFSPPTHPALLDPSPRLRRPCRRRQPVPLYPTASPTVIHSTPALCAMGTDNVFPSASSQDSTALLSTSPTLSSPRKRRLTRSPTPHALADHALLSSDDDPLSFHTKPRSRRYPSDPDTPIATDDTSPDQGAFASARMNLFATLTGMGSEELELALLTKANTRANSLVRKIDVSVSAASEESLPSDQRYHQAISYRHHHHRPLGPFRRLHSKIHHLAHSTWPTMSLKTKTGDEAGSESSQSSKNESPSLLPQPTMPKLDHHRKKRRRISHGLHEEQGNMHAEPVHSSQDVITGEIIRVNALLPGRRSRVKFVLVVVHILAVSILESIRTRWRSIIGSTELYSPVLAPKKTVRFDESRNIIFGYDRGSTIALSQTSAKEACIKDDEDDEELEDMDYGSQLDDIGYGYGDGITDSVMSSPSRWIWSSANVSGASIEPIPSDLEATSTSLPAYTHTSPR
ncbi:hypothetical protein B0O80DRAFT_263414 [Mortierella sp. GBAus27b]|nr:hypothetical protein B0O80DRAFT_263414 [Mortierella sp. GBAus27b]